MAILDVNSALHEFLKIQTCRAQLYTRFHEGCKTFIRIKHEGQFNALMGELTASFNECSRQVIAIEGGLKELGRADLAATLRSVQESERDKLRLTLTHQALKQAAAFRSFSWQQQQGGSGGGGDVVDDDEALALLDPHFAASARGGCTHRHGHSHGHSHGHGHSHEHEEAPAQSVAQDVGLAAAVSDAATGPCSRASCTAMAANGGVAAGGRCGAAAPVPPAAEPGADGAGGLEGVSSAGLRDDGGDVGAGEGCGVDGAGGDRNANGGSGGGTASVATSAGAPEPTRREFEAAVKESLQGIDACIRSINEAIGDVRMELEDG